jgi:hypothetical protein
MRIFVLFLFLICNYLHAQKFTGRLESGYLIYGSSYIVYATSGATNKPNGFDVNAIGSFVISKHSEIGIGAAYRNLKGTGVSAFAEYRLNILKTKLTPTLGTKIGYSHSNRNYNINSPDKKSTGLIELMVGIKYKLKKRVALNLSGGGLFTQGLLVFPVRAGFNF